MAKRKLKSILKEDCDNGQQEVLEQALEQEEKSKKEMEKVMKDRSKDAVIKTPKAPKTNEMGLVESLLEGTQYELKEDVYSLDVKDRKELGGIISKLKENKINFKISRSIKEGFRYTLSVNKLNESEEVPEEEPKEEKDDVDFNDMTIEEMFRYVLGDDDFVVFDEDGYFTDEAMDFYDSVGRAYEDHTGNSIDEFDALCDEEDCFRDNEQIDTRDEIRANSGELKKLSDEEVDLFNKYKSGEFSYDEYVMACGLQGFEPLEKDYEIENLDDGGEIVLTNPQKYYIISSLIEDSDWKEEVISLIPNEWYIEKSDEDDEDAEEFPYTIMIRDYDMLDMCTENFYNEIMEQDELELDLLTEEVFRLGDIDYDFDNYNEDDPNELHKLESAIADTLQNRFGWKVENFGYEVDLESENESVFVHDIEWYGEDMEEELQESKKLNEDEEDDGFADEEARMRAEFEAKLSQARDEWMKQKEIEKKKKELRDRVANLSDDDWTFDKLVEVLVPESGKADTKAGEMLRAMNDLADSYDYFFVGNGLQDYEADAAAYILNILEDEDDEDSRELYDLFIDIASFNVDANDFQKRYEDFGEKAKEVMVKVIKSHPEWLEEEIKSGYTSMDGTRYMVDNDLIQLNCEDEGELPREVTKALNLGIIDEEDVTSIVEGWYEDYVDGGDAEAEVDAHNESVTVYNIGPVSRDEGLLRWLDRIYEDIDAFDYTYVGEYTLDKEDEIKEYIDRNDMGDYLEIIGHKSDDNVVCVKGNLIDLFELEDSIGDTFGEYDIHDADDFDEDELDENQEEEEEEDDYDEDEDDDTNESLKEDKEEVKKETIELPHEEYTEVEDLIRVNNELGKKAEEGKLIPIRMEEDKLMLAEPAINGIWTIFLDKDGNITKIVLF